MREKAKRIINGAAVYIIALLIVLLLVFTFYFFSLLISQDFFGYERLPDDMLWYIGSDMPRGSSGAMLLSAPRFAGFVGGGLVRGTENPSAVYEMYAGYAPVLRSLLSRGGSAARITAAEFGDILPAEGDPPAILFEFHSPLPYQALACALGGNEYGTGDTFDVAAIVIFAAKDGGVGELRAVAYDKNGNYFSLAAADADGALSEIHNNHITAYDSNAEMSEYLFFDSLGLGNNPGKTAVRKVPAPAPLLDVRSGNFSEGSALYPKTYDILRRFDINPDQARSYYDSEAGLVYVYGSATFRVTSDGYFQYRTEDAKSGVSLSKFMLPEDNTPLTLQIGAACAFAADLFSIVGCGLDVYLSGIDISPGGNLTVSFSYQYAGISLLTERPALTLELSRSGIVEASANILLAEGTGVFSLPLPLLPVLETMEEGVRDVVYTYKPSGENERNVYAPDYVYLK